jgi:hypothetical protein
MFFQDRTELSAGSSLAAFGVAVALQQGLYLALS